MLPNVLIWNTSIATGMAIAIFLLQRVSWLKCRPALRHALWLLVLIKLVTPPLITVPVGVLPAPDDAIHALGPRMDAVGQESVVRGHGEAATVMPDSAPSSALDFGVILVGGSLLGTIALLVQSMWRTRRIGHLVRQADIGSGVLQETLLESSRKLNLKRPPSLRVVDGCVTPFLWVTVRGAFLVMPRALAARLDRQSVELVIKHELSHYARRDHLTNYFVFTVTALIWWHPVVWWARQELRLVQELCCDAMVLSTDQNQKRRYAETLLQTVDFVATGGGLTPVSASALGSRSTFQRRIEMISQSSLPYRVPLMARVVVVVLGILLIAGSPTVADPEDEEAVRQAHSIRAELREVEQSLRNLSERVSRLLRQEERPSRRSRDDTEDASERQRDSADADDGPAERHRSTSDRFRDSFDRYDEAIDRYEEGFEGFKDSIQRYEDRIERYEDVRERGEPHRHGRDAEEEGSARRSEPETLRRMNENRMSTPESELQRLTDERRIAETVIVEQRAKNLEAARALEAARMKLDRKHALREGREDRERAEQRSEGQSRQQQGGQSRQQQSALQRITRQQGLTTADRVRSIEHTRTARPAMDRELEELRAGRRQWLEQIEELQAARARDKQVIVELQNVVRELRGALDARSEDDDDGDSRRSDRD